MGTRLKIKEIAEAKGYNISRLARKADIAYQTLHAMWNDPGKDVALSTLAKIARVLNVDVSELVEGNGGTDGEETKGRAGLCFSLDRRAA